MINYHSNLVAALKQIDIPIHYEMTLHSGLNTPCISYMEISNIAEETGDTLGYSRLQYQIIAMSKTANEKWKKQE